MFSSYLLNRVFDLCNKILFFLDSAKHREYVGFLAKTRAFRELCSEVLCWRLGLARLDPKDPRLRLLRSASGVLESFTATFAQANLLAECPRKQNHPSPLASFRKAPADSLRELNARDLATQSPPAPGVFVTFNNLDAAGEKRDSPQPTPGLIKKKLAQAKAGAKDSATPPPVSGEASRLFVLTFSEVQAVHPETPPNPNPKASIAAPLESKVGRG